MEKNLSRRGFIGLGALGAAAAASLAACAPQAAGKPDAEASGLASTSADGGETTIPNTGNLEFFPPSGAEVAYIADPIADEDVVETVSCDVAVCGAGMSGVAAAASATEDGWSVVLLEKGATFAARGTEVAAFGDRAHAEADIVLNARDFMNDGLTTAHFRCDRSVWERWCERSGEALDWAMDAVGDACGAFTAKAGNAEFCGVTTWGSGVRIEKGIASFVETLLGIAEGQGADIRYNTPAVQLAVQDGKVTGVYAKERRRHHQGRGRKGRRARPRAATSSTGICSPSASARAIWRCTPGSTRRSPTRATASSWDLPRCRRGRLAPYPHERPRRAPRRTTARTAPCSPSCAWTRTASAS